MADATDPWVQRLREGATPPTWPVHLAALALVVASAALIVAELGSTAFVAEAARSSRVGSIVLLEVVAVVAGFGMWISTWWSGRRDRRVLARVRASGHRPAFFLPVLTKGIRTGEDLPRPRPEVWTIDAAGLHGWTADRESPVTEVPWARVRRIGLATNDSRGARVAYGLWLDLDQGNPLVLRPRTSLCRPFGAGPGALATLRSVVSALRRDAGARVPDADA
ncbi:hypothetical protein [Curtobacterium luteum]|uniref:hypothetical protein n=1 Tax=Curtobacterium luteum TaxID=33881 RepID=UPI0038271AC6